MHCSPRSNTKMPSNDDVHFKNSPLRSKVHDRIEGLCAWQAPKTGARWACLDDISAMYMFYTDVVRLSDIAL